MCKRKILLWVTVICLLAMLLPGAVSANANAYWSQNQDGSWSYYYYGEWVCDQTQWINGAFYGFDASGKMYTNKWYKDDWGNYYYFGADGKAYEEGVYKINGAYYGFDDYGCMYADTTFGIYDDARGQRVYYRAKADGSLYVNEWYQDDYENWYYYGAEGAAPSGFYQIGSTWYYFYGDGELRENDGIVEDNGKYYYLYNEGKSYVTLTTVGWYNVAGDYIYYEGNGELAQNEVKYIGGKYYGFNYYGKMYKDASFSASVYDEAKEQWVYYSYRAKADGTLYVNSWYESEGGDWYYYGAEGKAPYGFHKVGSTWYYFYGDGEICENGLVEDNGKYYYLYNEGKSYVTLTTVGWYNVAGDYIYYEGNGELAQNEVKYIGGKYYGFGWDYKMYVDYSFDVYNSDIGRWVYYRAKADGSLCVNEWYEDEWGDWYYYGAGGAAANDFTNVNGTWYFFNNGYMVTDQVVWSEAYQANYYISEDGKSSTKAPTNGWLQAGEDYYYFSNNEMYTHGVYQIGGLYYGFRWDGSMYSGTTFSISEYYEDLEYSVYKYYRARKDGSLYVNSWYQDGSNWYYYGAGGVAAKDFTVVNGTWYFFHDWGRMASDEIVWSEAYQASYYISEDGKSSTKAPTNGWLQAGEDYYYFSNGMMYQDGVYQIGGLYYGFNYNGVMYSDGTFSIDEYDDDLGYWNYKYYRARKDGSLYVNTWYQEGDSWYYYGAGGVGADGFVTIGGIEYYFYNGYMETDWVVHSNGAYYAIDENGKKITKKGWAQVEGSYVYVQADSTLFEDGWMLDSGKWYYLDPYMAANARFTDGDALYTVNNAGVCTKVTGTGIYDIGYSGKVYLENGKISTGWKYVGGAWYYFDTWMCANDVYEIDGKLYVFDQNGKMFTGGWLLLGDSYYEDVWPNYVYADASGKAVTGLQTIGGKQYIFSDYGYLLTEETVEHNGTWYALDEDGVATALTGTGWKNVAGKYYYVRGGELVYDEVVTIGGKMYAFDYDGVMRTDGIYHCYFPDEGYYYTFIGADGVIKTGWQKKGNDWYYADADGHLKNGLQTINGKEYFFAGVCLETGTFLWNGEQIFTTDANGVILSKKDLADGWTYLNGVVYYYKNGEAYTGWVGDYYIEDGRMRINTVIEDKNGDYYCIDIYGKYIKGGWYERVYESGYSDFFYAKSGGKLCYNEWALINGAWYYFSDYYMCSNGIYNIDGELCQFAKDGKYLGKVQAQDIVLKDGWYQEDSDWYYIHAGYPVIGVQHIDGKRYVFDYSGVMQTGFAFFEDCAFYTDSSGAVIEYTGWQLINKKWYYFNSSNEIVTGWFQDDGKVYYCEYVYNEETDEYEVELVTGYIYIEGKLHHFASSGVYQGTVGVENGWYSAGGEWYYFKNGEVQTGYQIIDGKGYYLTGSGLLKKEIAYTDDGYAYFDGNGVQRTTKGWYKTSEGWIYVLDNGLLANGVWMLGGKEYYFKYGIMVR